MSDQQGMTADTATAETDQQADKAVDWQAEAEKWKALARKHEQREKENAEKAKEYDTFKASQMSELEKAQAEAADLKARLEEMTASQRAAELSAIKARVGLEKKLPPALIDRLQGEDEKSIAADADNLLASIPSDSPTRVDIGQGDRGTNTAAVSNPLEAALRGKLGITT